MQTSNEVAPGLKGAVLIGDAGEFYPKLVQLREQHEVVEEFISCQVVQVSQPQLQGIKQLQPQMTVMLSGLVIYRERSTNA